MDLSFIYFKNEGVDLQKISSKYKIEITDPLLNKHILINYNRGKIK